jgi:hypothetical protein
MLFVSATCEGYYNVDTSVLTVGNYLFAPDSKREECMLAMPFWVLAVLSAAGALAIVWVLYLLVRRWL